MTDRVGQHFGNYQLVKLLGRGSFAEVYLGQHRHLNSYAALKVLHARLRMGDEQKFRAEAQTLVNLRHPNIVHLLDFGIENGTPVLIMDYAPNGSLRQHYPQGTQIPLVTVVGFVAQIAVALQYAHNHNVIHCDVKPENILLDADNRLLLSDFGLSLLTPSSEQLSRQDPAGTARYMAPEQLRGQPCFASDQYALAVMVYEWLCGKPPFSGTMWEVWQHHLSTPPPPLRVIRPELPLRLERVVLRALAKEPQDRFVSIQAFAQALARASQTATPVDEDALQVTVPLRAISRLSLMEHHAASLRDQIAQIPTRILTGVLPQPTGASALQRQNRMRLLQRVHSFWITGVLEQSLHGAALLALGLQEQPAAVANPWRLVVQESGYASSTPLPTGTPIIEVYDNVGGELLILGEPGSGKTTLLLELARHLLDRARRDDTHPMPVVFNLSTWGIKRQPLFEWLIEEMNTKYQVPRKLAQSWVESDQVLPLLDGLDEVVPEAITTCIEAINTYRQEHSLGPMIICSRSTAYSTQKAQICLKSAVVVRPLTIQQVDDYLSHAGGQLEALHVALRNNQALQELVTTPLMLSILTLACYRQPPEDLLMKTTSDDLQRLVFATYVERMLERRRVEPRYTSQQTISWLTWLAHQMKQHNQTLFFLERMQMDWLPKNVWYQLSPSIVIGLLIGCVATLNYILGIVFFTGFSRALLLGLFFGLLTGCMYTVLNGLVFGLLGTKDRAGRPVETLPWSWAEVRRNGVRFLGNRLTYGLIFGVFFGALYWWISPAIYRWDYVAVPIFRLSVGLYNGLLTGVNLGTLGRLGPEIQPAEVFVWSWVHMRRAFPKYLAYGLLIGCAFGISIAATPLGFIGGLSVGLLFGLIFGTFYSLSSGLSNKLQDDRNLTRPNQGIWRSARTSFFNALISAAISGLFAGTVFGLLFGSLRADVGLVSGVTSGLSTLLSVGLIVGLRQGGTACIQHILLRWHLWRTRSIPWNYPHFLDYAAERILLRKVGGGYIFVHRLLTEYFASLHE